MSDDKQFDSGLHQYYDPVLGTQIIKIRPGEVYVSQENVHLVTVLGSCISACVYESKLNIGGMNHFMFPNIKTLQPNEDDGKHNICSFTYGNWAIEALINRLLNLGGKRENLEVKVFGGGEMREGLSSVGRTNIDFVLTYLVSENLKITGRDLGGKYPRFIIFNPTTGKVKVKRLLEMHAKSVSATEDQYLADIRRHK